MGIFLAVLISQVQQTATGPSSYLGFCIDLRRVAMVTVAMLEFVSIHSWNGAI